MHMRTVNGFQWSEMKWVTNMHTNTKQAKLIKTREALRRLIKRPHAYTLRGGQTIHYILYKSKFWVFLQSPEANDGSLQRARPTFFPALPHTDMFGIRWDPRGPTEWRGNPLSPSCLLLQKEGTRGKKIKTRISA